MGTNQKTAWALGVKKMPRRGTKKMASWSKKNFKPE